MTNEPKVVLFGFKSGDFLGQVIVCLLYGTQPKSSCVILAVCLGLLSR